MTNILKFENLRTIIFKCLDPFSTNSVFKYISLFMKLQFLEEIWKWDLRESGNNYFKWNKDY